MGEVLRLDSGLAQANFGPVPGGRLPAGGRYAARTGGCGTARALEIRRVFGNRLSIANVMAQRRRLGLPGSLLAGRQGSSKVPALIYPPTYAPYHRS